ncbi:MAG: DUF262 domain-containing protein [Nitrospiraceae bacterium]
MAEESDLTIQDSLGDESEEIVLFKYSITSYGADYPVDGLVRRIADGSIFVPQFQRGYVWNLSQASRFIESLLLGLPVPGIFLSKESDSQKLLVIDGQQRLRTLQYFYEGIFQPTQKAFALRGVQSKFNGITYKTLPDEDRRRLDDSILHAIIVKQDEPSEDQSSVYYLFERLNTGGVLLQPQEIRACIYHGEFNNLLKQLNDNSSWRAIFGPVNSRMRDQELILRFLALFFKSDEYKKPMKEFLNIYMGKNKGLTDQAKHELTRAFVGTIELVHSCMGSAAFKPKRTLNAAVFDAVMVGVAKRLRRGGVKDKKALTQKYHELLDNADFISACETGTAGEESVSRRIGLATTAFADVE